MQLKIEYIPIDKLKPYERNNKKHIDYDIDEIAKSIEKYGFNDPIGIWKDNIIIEGHGRLEACKKLGITEVPCVRLDHLTDKQRREYAIMHNKTAELAEYDFDNLKLELDDLDLSDFDIDFGIDDKSENNRYKYEDYTSGSLVDKFGAPPFSVIDRRQKYWQDRKRQWLEKGITSEIGRNDNLLSGGMAKLGKAKGNLTGTSVFDPCLCEIMYKWFCPESGKILDCFAGGSVRGIVASMCGYDYYGNDLRQEQINANIENAKQIGCNMPNWYCGDSVNIKNIVPSQKYDFLFSCPPYADLEVYSDDKADISNMEYDDFLKVYTEIIKSSVNLLADNRFACFVVGDIRDKKGYMREFISDTIKAFGSAGMKLYNEIILIDPIGTGALRATKPFIASRKVTHLHQNVLVFYKGDIKAIKENYSDVYFPEIEDEEME